MSSCIRCRKEMGETPFCPYCGAKQERSKRTKKRGNGQGTAYKRKGQSSWTARVTIGFVVGKDGRHIQKYRTKGGFKTQTAALQYCAQAEAFKSSPKKSPNLLHYWELFSVDELASISRNRQRIYRSAWQRMKSLHMVPVDQITVSDLRKVVAASTSTHEPAKAMKTVFSHLFRLASADGFASKDLPEHIILPKATPKEREPFTDIEQASLWKLYESGDKRAAVPLLMIYTGMMPGELQGLTVDMIDLENAQIIGAGLKTDVRKESPIFLPDIIVPVIESLCEGRDKYVLPRNEKRFYEEYYAALEAAGCRRLSPYSCRHTTATALAVTEGIAPQTIKKIMRWSTSRMLDRYAHPSSKDAVEAINSIKTPSKTGL